MRTVIETPTFQKQAAAVWRAERTNVKPKGISTRS
jgi:hypothetical protein